MRCLRCNRLLKDPMAISRGYGNVCWSKQQDGQAEVAASLEPVPSNENVIEGTEGMLLLTNGLRGDEIETYLGDVMAIRGIPDHVIDAVFELRGEWAADSNTPLSRALEKYVAEMLHLPRGYQRPTSYKVPDLTTAQKQAAEVIYDITQRLLQAKEVDSLILYRGMGWSYFNKPAWVTDENELGTRLELPSRTLSSWSFDPSVARSYISEQEIGYVLKSKVPAKQIFAIIDVDTDQESVCIFNTQAEIVEIQNGEVSP